MQMAPGMPGSDGKDGNVKIGKCENVKIMELRGLAAWRRNIGSRGWSAAEPPVGDADGPAVRAPMQMAPGMIGSDGRHDSCSRPSRPSHPSRPLVLVVPLMGESDHPIIGSMYWLFAGSPVFFFSVTFCRHKK
jgi:hypothetical protein